MYDLSEIVKSDTLRIGTMTGATSYFFYRDEFLGYDYELAEQIAEDLGVNLKVTEAKSEKELLKLLEEKKIDIVAYNIFETNELKERYSFVMPQDDSYQVIVQRISADMATDVTDLVDKKIYAHKNTILYKRLESLNSEMGDLFKIVPASDTLNSEDLIEMVADGKIDYTVAYYSTASLYRSYLRKLDCDLQIGFNQRNGWLIPKENTKLKDFLDQWVKNPDNVEIMGLLHEKYWLRSPYFAMRKVRIPKGAISPYDHLFKKYAREIDWDWHLLAAVAFHESKFDSTQISWAGAAGIMQLMPRTAAVFGLNRRNVFNPAKNIEAGVQYIKSLNMSFRKVENKEERIKFILAAYNSGPAHVLDAMALAEKYGKNPYVWFGSVEYFLQKKSEPKYYNDPVVKYGRFRGKETISYVVKTLATYQKYSGKRIK
jgi:membrane-bound lytic murein transglycosylase F